MDMLTRRKRGEHPMHGTIKVGGRTIHGAITPIPEGTSAHERLNELQERGISAHLVDVGDNEHRILLQDPVKVRLERPNRISPNPDGQS